MRMSRSAGSLRHPRFHQRQVLLFAPLHLFHRDGVQLGRVVIGVLENGEAAQDLAGLQHLPAHAADHVLQAER